MTNLGEFMDRFNGAGPRELALAEDLLRSQGLYEAAAFGVAFEAAKIRTCTECGCTDDHACLDEQTGAPCHWVEGFTFDVCSVCANIALAVVYADERDVADHIRDIKEMVDEPRVQLYSEGAANRAIRAMRAGGAA